MCQRYINTWEIADIMLLKWVHKKRHFCYVAVQVTGYTAVEVSRSLEVCFNWNLVSEDAKLSKANVSRVDNLVVVFHLFTNRAGHN